MNSSDQLEPGTDWSRLFIRLVLLAAGALMLAAGVWCLVSPRSFAGFAGFPYSRHFIHDAGAFQAGIGVTLLLAGTWADAAAVALAGFLAGNTVHAVNHAVDLSAGGTAAEVWGLALISLLVLVALVQRLRGLGYVVGEVAATTSPVLARFSRQKTVALTTYRRDGTPVATPVSQDATTKAEPRLPGHLREHVDGRRHIADRWKRCQSDGMSFFDADEPSTS